MVLTKFPKNCMKLKEILLGGGRGGGARPKFYNVDPHWIAKRLHCRAKCWVFNNFVWYGIEYFHEERNCDEENVRNLVYDNCIMLESNQTFCCHALLELIGNRLAQNHLADISYSQKPTTFDPFHITGSHRIIRICENHPYVNYCPF